MKGFDDIKMHGATIEKIKNFYIESKGKLHPATCCDDTERELRYSSTLSLISALDGVGG